MTDGPPLVGQSADPWVDFVVGCKIIKQSELFINLDIFRNLKNTTENQYCENTSASLPFLKYLASLSFGVVLVLVLFALLASVGGVNSETGILGEVEDGGGKKE